MKNESKKAEVVSKVLKTGKFHASIAVLSPDITRIHVSISSS